MTSNNENNYKMKMPVVGRGYRRIAPTFLARKPIKDRLIENSSIDQETGCWNWNGSLINKGYGQISIKGKNCQPHRISWKVFVGEIPKGMQINHKCHNSKCINPEHLYTGTQQENIRDMDLSNRRSISFGSKCNQSRLNDGLIKIIRDSLSKGSRACDLANEFGVGRTCIANIKHKRTWKHVK